MDHELSGRFVGVPTQLEERAFDSTLRGRVAFAVAPNSDATLKMVAGLPGVSLPATPSDLFGRGVGALFRNYLAGRGLDAGIAALTDDDGFLRAVRRLTDSVYTSALARFGAERIVDASPSNEHVAELIRAVYPDAPLIATPDDAEALAQGWSGARPESLPAPPPVSPMLGEAPVFIVGVPRSGTTWMKNMLLAHPGLAGPTEETSLFVSLRALRENGRRPAHEGLAGWVSPPELVAAVRRFAEELLGGWLERTGHVGARLLEKTPLHGEHLRLITEVFPDAAVVSIHRDGRDVVRSLLEMDAATDDVIVAASRWTAVTRQVSSDVAALPHARDLRYETVVEDPVGATTGLLEWLGLAVDDAVEREVQRRAEARVSQYNTTGEVGPGKWTSLSAREQRAVYRHAGDRLVELGYIDAADLRRVRSRPVYRLEQVLRRRR
ncbi:MAG TPA: sulfotransferase [Acidimicrobiales bacterium]|nr:sulfotransferase [Acidimicrobiales bacterium]